MLIVGHYGWMLSSLAPARRRLVLALAAATVAAIVAVLAVVIAHGSGSRSHPVAQSDPGPVLLVPGYGGSTTSLQPLASTLARRRARRCRSSTLPDNAQGDLDAQAVALGPAVKARAARHRRVSVDVVGYSAGGVVARLWVRDTAVRALARRVVTLGLAAARHRTGRARRRWCRRPARRPASSWPRTARCSTALNAGDETPAGPQWVSVWTTHDNVVAAAGLGAPGRRARRHGAEPVPVATPWITPACRPTRSCNASCPSSSPRPAVRRSRPRPAV